MPMHDWLSHQTTSRPGAIALVEGGKQWTYAQLNGSVATLCSHLAGQGVAPGQRVAALLPTCAQYVFLVHALARLGATLVPLNLRLTPQELRWQLEQARCAFLVHNGETAPQVAALGSVKATALSLEELAALP